MWSMLIGFIMGGSIVLAAGGSGLAALVTGLGFGGISYLLVRRDRGRSAAHGR